MFLQEILAIFGPLCYNLNMNIYTVPKLDNEECTTHEWHHPTIMHKHTDWEFTTLTEGTGENVVNDVVYPFSYGTFLLLGPKHRHQQTAVGAIARRDICLSEHCLKKFCDELQEGLYEELCAYDTPIFIKMPLNSYKGLISRLTELDGYKTLSPTLTSALLHSIISYLLGIYLENAHTTGKHASPPWFLEFIRKIQKPEYFSKKIEDLVSYSNYTHAHFLLLFKQQTGQTLISYITDLRMNYAAQLLLSTDISVIQIANEVGYDNHSFFSQKFRKRFGVTPVEYRKRNTPLTE